MFNLQLRQLFSGSVKMTNRKPKVSSIRLAPALRRSEHAQAIVSIGNELRASVARTCNIPVKQVKLEITVAVH